MYIHTLNLYITFLAFLLIDQLKSNLKLLNKIGFRFMLVEFYKIKMLKMLCKCKRLDCISDVWFWQTCPPPSRIFSGHESFLKTRQHFTSMQLNQGEIMLFIIIILLSPGFSLNATLHWVIQRDTHHVVYPPEVLQDMFMFYVLHHPQPKSVLSSHCLTICTSACLLMVGQSICLLISTHLSVYSSASFWSQCVCVFLLGGGGGATTWAHCNPVVQQCGVNTVRKKRNKKH